MSRPKNRNATPATAIPAVSVPSNLPTPAGIETTPADPTYTTPETVLSVSSDPTMTPAVNAPADPTTPAVNGPTAPVRVTMSSCRADIGRTPLSPADIAVLESIGLDSRTLTASGRVAVAVGSSPTATALMRRTGRTAYPSSVALIYRDGTPVPMSDLPPVRALYTHARTVLSAVIDNAGFNRNFRSPVDHMIDCRYGDSGHHADTGMSPIDRFDFATEYARRVMIAAGRRDADDIITPGRSRSAVMRTRAVETLALLDASIAALPAAMTTAANGATGPTIRKS